MILLAIQCVIFAECKYIILCLLSYYDFSAKELLIRMVPNNYYITRYSVLYLISPLINLCFKDKDVNRVNQVVIGLLVLFSVIPTGVAAMEDFTGIAFSELNTVGGNVGYTITNFVVMYIVGLNIRMQSEEEKSQVGNPILYFLASAVLLFIWELTYIHKTGWFYGSALSYSNPLVIILAVSVFKIFRTVSINDAIGKVINELAKAGLTVYLFHGFFISLLPIDKIMNMQSWLMMLVLICTCIFIACYLVNKIWDFTVAPLATQACKNIKWNNVFDLSNLDNK